MRVRAWYFTPGARSATQTTGGWAPINLATTRRHGRSQPACWMTSIPAPQAKMGGTSSPC